MRLEVPTRRFYLGRDYSEAIQGMGGEPVHLSLIPKLDYISAALDGLDGILLPGSDSDLDPAYFGEEPHPRLKSVVPVKDETDLMVLKEAERRGLPLLGICYGMQALNVSRGGTLYQDLESQTEGGIKHDQGTPLERNSHSISIANGSILAAILSSGNGDSTEVRVNSHHHQAIKAVGRGLEAVAWAKDGVVECIQDTRPESFVLGVQWHPELSWNTDEISRRIFKEFLSRC
ncbi:MAG: gamma-glutamyl-gamma-aminobutyrate hydrolase family protein [Pyrinomonadaceae bacterium]